MYNLTLTYLCEKKQQYLCTVPKNSMIDLILSLGWSKMSMSNVLVITLSYSLTR